MYQLVYHTMPNLQPRINLRRCRLNLLEEEVILPPPVKKTFQEGNRSFTNKEVMLSLLQIKRLELFRHLVRSEVLEVNQHHQRKQLLRNPKDLLLNIEVALEEMKKK